MNLRNSFIRLFDWCPGVTSAAKLVPDREISEQKLNLIGAFTLVSFFALIIYSIQANPSSYDWNLDFEDALIDDATGLYFIKEAARIDGRYQVKVEVDATPGERVIIQTYQSTENHLSSYFLYVNGTYYRNGNDPVGSKLSFEMDSQFYYIFKILSSSDESSVHITIEYLGKSEYWPAPV